MRCCVGLLHLGTRAIILEVAAASNLKLDVDAPQRTILPWGIELIIMLGHVSELESELLWTRTESILETIEYSDLDMASWFAVALATRKPVAPSLLWSRLELEFGEKN